MTTRTEPTITAGEFDLVIKDQLFFSFPSNDDDLLVINPDLTYEQWCEGLGYFKNSFAKARLYFAQYLDFGSKKFGRDKMESGIEQLSFDLPTVKSCLAINTVPPEIRRPGLTAEHYVVLAKSDLKKKEMIKWADRAHKQNLSPSTLKVSIQNGEVVDPSVARQQLHGILTIQAIVSEFNMWSKRIGGVEGALKMEVENRQEIVNEMKGLVEFHAAVLNSLA